MRTIIPIALLVVVALLVFIQMRPDRFHIERSAVIDAPDSAILPHINDFHAWPAWSPFEKIDPQLRRSYDGPASGVGAGYHWAGNSQIGEGSMKIMESTPDRVGIALTTPRRPVGVAGHADHNLQQGGRRYGPHHQRRP